MALTSMTGYGRKDLNLAGLTAAWDIRSVNGRNLDLRLRLPPGFDQIEAAVRQQVAKRVRRGNLTVNLQIEGGDEATLPRLDRAVLDSLIIAAKDAASRHGLEAPRVEALLALPGVLRRAGETAMDAAAVTARDAAVLAGLDAALEALTAARQAEGRHLAAALAGHLDEIAALTDTAARLAAALPGALHDRMSRQLDELLAERGAAINPDRLAQEVAMLATKADIREELDRLRAHVAEARKLLAGGDAVGRRLDFLAQEFNREANTLCSKASDVELTRIGLDLKTAIDRLREQVQNVE